ncbi:MAG: hypothetical protein A3J97_10360 [Spirochaetes bacterium RIFOXYC1_FULL_54_7]|nr:MAG: hypothetical protein A3J97_10360 [Spirochaetes bacterium RIFOXYC1_FULL_54_7]
MVCAYRDIVNIVVCIVGFVPRCFSALAGFWPEFYTPGMPQAAESAVALQTPGSKRGGKGKLMLSRTEYLRKQFEARINKAVDFAYANCRRDFDPAGMADAACFSRFHFHRLFYAFTGETPGEFVKRIRLARAAGLLRNNPGLDINNHGGAGLWFFRFKRFPRAFRNKFGVPPRRYAPPP